MKYYNFNSNIEMKLNILGLLILIDEYVYNLFISIND